MRQLLVALAISTALTAPAFAQSAKVPPAITVTEGSSWSVPVDRVGPKGSTISFGYKTVNGTAVAGSDFTARSGNQSIRKTATRYTLTGPTIDDTIWEPDEAFQLVVTIPGQTPLVTAITIKDNDPKPPVACPPGTVLSPEGHCVTAPPPPPTPVTCPDGSVVIPPATCPTTPPPPTDPLTGETPIASNFDVSPYLLDTPIPVSAAPDDKGAFRFICNAGQLLYDDPIVYPGQPGKSHLHQFYGNASADAYSTYAILRANGTSSCEGPDHPALNRSAYWMPAMLDGQGNVVRPDFVSIYYKRRPADDPICNGQPGAFTSTGKVIQGQCVALPNGLKFIFGYDMLTGKSPTGRLWYACQINGVATGIKYSNLEQVDLVCPVGTGQIGAVIEAPDCWNGQLDSANHRDHVAYGSYGDYGFTCPKTHPYVISSFTLGAWFTKTNGLWRLSSDEMVPTLPRGSTFHADFFMAWDPFVHGLWEGPLGCINRLLNCSAGDTGTGKRVKGMEIRYDPAPKVVPVPPRPAP